MANPEEGTVDNRQSTLTATYQEVCTGYHAIDNFRAKLLGFLPLASGAGIFLLLNPKIFGQSETGEVMPPEVLLGVGLFGFAVTLGLFFYEFRGISYCLALIKAGQNLEEQLEAVANEGGQNPTQIEGFFRSRPPRISRIGARAAAQVVYPSVLAAWSFVALFGYIPTLSTYVPTTVLVLLVFITVFVAFFVVFVLMFRKLEASNEGRSQTGDAAGTQESSEVQEAGV